jgi:hypothetical protein
MKMKLVIAAAALLVVGLSTTASAPAQQKRYSLPELERSRPGINHCVLNYVRNLERRGDARTIRLNAQTNKRGGTIEAADTLRGTPDYVSVHRQAWRACKG